jgi:hypothetical protein
MRTRSAQAREMQRARGAAAYEELAAAWCPAWYFLWIGGLAPRLQRGLDRTTARGRLGATRARGGARDARAPPGRADWCVMRTSGQRPVTGARLLESGLFGYSVMGVSEQRTVVANTPVTVLRAQATYDPY